MPGFGAKLRQERENRGFTLDQIADATRINPRYLKALEADELVKLPGTVFNKGYVRAYAGFIGADAEPLVRAYTEEEQAQEAAGQISRPDVIEGMAHATAGRRVSPGPDWRRFAFPALAVVILAVAGWSLIGRSGPADDAETPAPGETRSIPAAVERDEQLPARAAPVQTTATPRQPDDTPQPQPTTSPPRSEPTSPRQEEVTLPREETTTPRQPEATTARQEQTPPSQAEATPPPAAVESGGRITITEFGVGTGVSNRRLVGESDRFAPETRVWFWTRVLGGSKGETIRHVWLHEGRPITSTELRLGGSHWRTQSRKTLHAGAEGRWTVEARDSNGRVLARSEFICGPG